MAINNGDPRMVKGARVIASHPGKHYNKGDTGKLNATYGEETIRVIWDEGTRCRIYCDEKGYRDYGSYLINLDFYNPHPTEALFT